MALIKCPDCGTEVSDRAPSCPKCGAPIAAAAETTAAGAPLTTTQGTSKKLKLQSLIAGVILVFSLVALSGGASNPEAGAPTLPLVFAAGSLIWLLVTRIRIWWHHS